MLPERRPRRRAHQPTHRENLIAARFSDQEKAEIHAAAARAGRYPSGFVALAALNAARTTTPPEHDGQLHAAIDELAVVRTHIARVGNNLNQIARALNCGDLPHPAALDHALAVLVRALAAVDAAAHAVVQRVG